VFADLSDLIVEHSNTLACGDVLNSGTVDIEIVWENVTPSVVLGIGSPFYSSPANVNCNEMVLDRPFIKINGGVVSPFANEIFDGRLTINAQPPAPLSWHIDPNTMVGPQEVDLYSVTLHEALHILGFASRVGFNDAYTLWDRTLHLSNDFFSGGGGQMGNPILTNSDPGLPCSISQVNCWNYNGPEVTNGNIDALIDNTCDNNPGTPDVVVGEFAIAAIDWANGGANAAALSHLSETCNNNPAQIYVMRGGFNPGMERRTISTDELQIMCEIGYEIASPNYSCEGCYAIATDDGVNINSCCSQAFHGCIGEPIEILNSELLCNDVTNGQNLTIGDVWVANPNNINLVTVVQNVNEDGWIITFDPGVEFTGSQLFNYNIVGCDCRMHNARFIAPCIFKGTRRMI
jgi:hypothetical protein